MIVRPSRRDAVVEVMPEQSWSLPQDSPCTVSVVVPTYNEEKAIGPTIEQILRTMDDTGLAYELIVVDDGSTDRTAEIVMGYERVRLVRHHNNRGTGAATKTGIKYARGEIMVMTDADGTYPNDMIPSLLAQMNDYDMVIGARAREAGTMRWLRTPAKTFIRLLASYMTETKIPDLNSGLRCFRKELALQFLGILPNGFSWVSTITMAFLSAGYPVGWVPISYYKRVGRSKFHPLRDTYNYLTLVVRTVMFFNPLRIFIPLTAFLLLLGAGKLIRDILVYNWHIPGSTIMLVLTGVQVGAIGMLADLIVRKGK